MDFQLTDEQRQLADSFERVLNDRYDFETRRSRLAGRIDEAFWPTLAELGLFALPVTDANGGFGGGAVDLMRPMALAGRALLVEPLHGQLVGCRLLDRIVASLTDSSARGWRDRLAEAIAGTLRVAVAQPSGEQDGDIVARPLGDGQWQVDGHADQLPATALDSHALLLAAARVEAGPDGADPDGTDPDALAPAVAAGGTGTWRLLALDAPTAGLTFTPDTGLDRQPAARLDLDGFQASSAAWLGRGETVAAALEDARDFASALLCAEAVGLIEYACEATLEYLKTRRQFGVPIGSFQALQHRIVDLHVELEQVRSMAALAASKVDAAAAGQIDAAERRRSVAAARVLVARVADRVAQESVQLHGGMGMAEELKISHTFRRLTVLARQGGSGDWHLDRFRGVAA